MAAADQRSFGVGSWRVEPSLNRLVEGQRTEQIEPKVMRVRTLAFNQAVGAAAHEIFLIDTDAGEPRQLTDDRMDLGGFDWSADGRDLIVSSNRGGGFGLWRQPAAAGEPSWLGMEDAFLPSLARGADALVFERRQGDVDLMRLSLNEPSEPARPWAASTQYDLEPDYSPDGRQVAFVSRRGGSFELWLADAEGGQPRQLTFFRQPSPAWNPSVQHPRWHPAGDALVFSARAGEDFDIYEISAEGGTPRPYTASLADDVSPVWSEGGDWIYFASASASASGDGWQLWRARRGEDRLEPLGMALDGPEIEPYGPGRLLLRLRDRGLAVWSPGGPSPVDADLPTGLRGWAASRGGAVALVFPSELLWIDRENGQQRRLRSLVDPPVAAGLLVVTGGLALSPDGGELLYAGVRSFESDLVLVEGLR